MGRARAVILSDRQARFVELIGRGVNNSEACRLVGVNRRTGTRWRFGRSILNTAGEAVQYSPVTDLATANQPRHRRYLSMEERFAIADLVRSGSSVRDIARHLGRAPSTISRELHRNPHSSGRYLPQTADRMAISRQARPRQRRIATDLELREAVNRLLAMRWSHEQVAHELRERNGDRPRERLSAESIYQAVYDPAVPVCRPAR